MAMELVRSFTCGPVSGCFSKMLFGCVGGEEGRW